MVPAAFEEVNLILTSDLPDVEALQAHIDEEKIITCWKITEEEWEEINRTKRIWVLTKGHLFIPMAVTGNKPI